MKLPRSSTGWLLLLAGFLLPTMSGCGSKPGSSTPSWRSTAIQGVPPGATLQHVCLRVDQYQIPGATASGPGPFGNTDPITLWSYVLTGTGDSCTFASPAPATELPAPSIPLLTAAEGTYLTVHLQNNLPAGGGGYTEPVSIVIAGQSFAGSDAAGSPGPTWTDGTVGPRNPGASPPQRVRSFTVEAPLGASGSPGSVTSYAFGPLKAGTYLYQSGTHPAVQVQMGLYGPLVVLPATAGQAYADPSSAYDQDVALLLSEIDPVLHAAVAAGQYGPNPNAGSGGDPPAGWLTSTSDYHPRYFLMNGKPYTAGASALPVPPNKRILLRFLNAGLETKVPQLKQYLSLIAEDGNFYSATGPLPSGGRATCPAPRVQYSAFLPAGKTVDAILITPSTANTVLPIYDRRLNLTNNGASPGGLYAALATDDTPPGPPLPAPAACPLL